jgi:hypothetical protein
MRVGRGVVGDADEGTDEVGDEVAVADDGAGRLLTERQRRLSWWAEGGGKQCLCGSGEVQSRQMRRAIRAGGEVQGRRRWSVRADSTRRRAVGIVRSEGDRPRSGESRVRAPGTTYGQWTRNVAGAQRGQKFLALRVGLLLAVATTTPRKFTPRDTVTSCCGERWESRDGEVKGRQPR